MLFPLLILAVLLIPVLGAYSISRVVYKTLTKAEKPNANVIRIVTMIGSFIVILAAILVLILFNIPFER